MMPLTKGSREGYNYSLSCEYTIESFLELFEGLVERSPEYF